MRTEDAHQAHAHPRVHRAVGHSSGVHCVICLRDGRVLSGSDDTTLIIWDTQWRGWASCTNGGWAGHSRVQTEGGGQARARISDGRGLSIGKMPFNFHEHQAPSAPPVLVLFTSFVGSRRSFSASPCTLVEPRSEECMRLNDDHDHLMCTPALGLSGHKLVLTGHKAREIRWGPEHGGFAHNLFEATNTSQ